MKLAIAFLCLVATNRLFAVQVTGSFNGVRLSHANQYEYAPSIIQGGGTTRIWFCAGETIGSERFNDLIHYSQNWAASQRQLCPSEGLSASFCSGDYPSGPDQVHVCDPSVVKVGGVYKLYYTALNYQTPGDDATATNYVFLAQSTDGVNWVKYPNASQQPIPIITSGVHNGRYGTGQQSVLYKDGVYHMYYTNQQWYSESRIEHVTSTDGVTFGSPESLYPQTVTPDGTWAVDVKYIDGWDLWFMVSSGDDVPDSASVYWNISRDGRHWLPFNASRLIPKGSVSAHNPGIVGNELGHIGNGTIGPQVVEVAFGNDSAGDFLSDLASSTITLTPEQLYGNFDGISASKIATGWAYDPDTGTNDAAANGGSNAPLGHSTYVSVWVDGVPKHNWQPSEVQRCDVRDAGLAPDCYHGFAIDLHGIVPSGTHTVQIEGGEFPSGGGGRMLPGTHTVTMP
jgi:hypothetical protein